LIDGHWIRLVFNAAVLDLLVSGNGQINVCDSGEATSELGPDR
jgi:hypothetical protein